ncbi:MAG: nucleoside recognition protein, partial [Planctomycetes bacterium]|nr:nucleoside recognition protein [Planctomycetota bacterium]
MINVIWMLLIVIAVITGIATGNMQGVTEGAMNGAKSSVEIALGLIGFMALWLGLMKVAEEAGLVQILARLVRPIMRRIFPDVPPDHPAMGAMLMNMAANALGLGNAATPLGLKAMKELQTLNDYKDQATNAMATFLAINTSDVTIIPATVIGIRVAAGSANPTEI